MSRKLYKLITKQNIMTNKMYYEFHVVKWDETVDKLLEKHKMTVQRQSVSSARTVVRKKYNPSDGYFEELNSCWQK